MSVTLSMVCGLALLMLIIVTGPPIPYAFAAAVLFFFLTIGVNTNTFFPTGYSNVKAYILVSLPLFIVAGGMMTNGHIGNVLVGWIETFTGRFRSGLIQAAIIACALFGSVCGSGAATLTCIGSVMGPKLEERNYPRGVYAAVLCCAAPLGMLIPPSSIQIVFAWTCNISVLGCFLAIVIPGIILMTLECVVSYFIMKKFPNNLPEPVILPPKQWVKTVGKTTYSAIPAILMPVIILGGIYSGAFTPTEAAAVSVVYALIVGKFVYKKLDFKTIKKTFWDASVTTGTLLLLVFFAVIMSNILIRENMPNIILGAMTRITDSKLGLLLMVNLFMVILGMFADDTSGTLLAAPLLLPIFKELGLSPYHFAAILGVNLGMGNITPPCAPYLYLASRLFKCPVQHMFKYVGYIIAFAYIPTLILVTYIPELSLWLPRLVMGEGFNLYFYI